jgi:hypothetical protein
MGNSLTSNISGGSDYYDLSKLEIASMLRLVPPGDLESTNDFMSMSVRSSLAGAETADLEGLGSIDSEKIPVAALAGNGIGLYELAPANSSAIERIPTSVSQENAIAKYGKFREFEGRRIEILAPGDSRLPGQEVNKGFIYIMDPTKKVAIVDATKPWMISEVELITPPSQRPKISMGELLKNSPKSVDAKLPDWWSNPNAPKLGDYQQIQAPLIPGQEDARIVYTFPGSVSNGGPKGEKLNNNPERVVSQDETNRAIREGKLLATHGFPSQDNVVGIADFDKDGKKDLLLRNTSTGEMQIWYMNGQNKIGEAPVLYGFSTPGSNWAIEGVGDFNNDQSVDIVWRELGGGGSTAIWFMNNNQFVNGQVIGTQFGNIPSNWRIDGVADFDNDGKNDLLWRDYSTGQNYFWKMNGSTYVSATQIASQVNPPASWKIAGVSDFNGDGIQDIFWRENTTGSNAYWQMSAGYASIANGVLFATQVPALGWTMEEVGDVNSNGTADIVWKAPNGSHAAWILGQGSNSVPSIISGALVPGNSISSTTGFNTTNGSFHSEFGYGMVDTAAAIALLKNQTPPLEQYDSIGFNVNLNNTRQNEILNLPEVWQQGFTGQGIIVAVIDSGVALSHPALSNNIWSNPGEIAGDGIDNDNNGYIDDKNGWDFINNDNDPNPVFNTSNTHGTNVSGMISSQLVQGGFPVQGGAYNAKIMALRVGLNSGIDPNAAADAVRYAANNGAKVINLSFGGGVNSGDPSQVNLTSAINLAVSKGAVVVISAGNGGSDTIDTVFPAILAGSPGVIAVGATNAGTVGSNSSNNSASQVASFSTGAGTTIRKYVTAPGSNILTTSFNTTAYGYAYAQGTSFSAPLVAAAVATIKQAVPWATPAQITDALAQTADPSDIYI